MQNYGGGSANANPSMMGVTPAGGDNVNEKPVDPSGPQSRTMMSESEQHSALSAGARAAKMFPRDGSKDMDETYE